MVLTEHNVESRPTFIENDEVEEEILETAHRNFRPIFLYRQRVAERQRKQANRNSRN